MPCNSDYLNPNQEEKNKVRVAKLILYAADQLGIKPKSKYRKAAKDCYGNGINLDKAVADLCGTLNTVKSTHPKSFSRIVYNAKDKNSRDLANWWEEHVSADKKRVKEETKEKLEAKIREKALAKLSTRERKVLGL